MPSVRLLLLVLFAGFSLAGRTQPKPAMPPYNYTSAWKRVQELEKKGLPESALKEVERICARAKADANAAQTVKAVIHRFAFAEDKEEDAHVKNIAALHREIATAQFPLKPVLHSMLAQLYWSYYQNNRWRFRNRTETVGVDNDDLQTWTLDKLVQETSAQYALSLQDPRPAQKLRLDLYDPVLTGGNAKGRALRPTLYHFLAHRALDFYAAEEPDITRPAYAFTLDAATYLADAATFATLPIATPDTASLKYKALRLFQELSAFQGGLVLDLQRLAFVKQHLVLPDKNQLYVKALQALEARTLADPASTLVTHALAEVWAEQGRQYEPFKAEQHRLALRTAYDLCETAKKRFSDSDGATLCHNLQVSLSQKEISLQLERVNVPGQPFRALVGFRNVAELHWRIVPVTRDEVLAQRRKWQNNYQVDGEEKFMEWARAKAPLKTGRYTLPDDKDLQTHRVEVKLDALPVGTYLMLFSHAPDFQTRKNGMAYGFTTVSAISYTHRNRPDGSTEFYVLHRDTGRPLPGVQAQTYVRTYDAARREHVYAKAQRFATDADGRFQVPYRSASDHTDRTFHLDFTLGPDHLDMRDPDGHEYYNGQLYQYPQEPPQRTRQTLLFLDRAIYRPGQPLYYKGLVFETDGKAPAIRPKQTGTVIFYDVNHQEVARQAFTTNEYGTFSGTFTTPAGGLLGQMSLETDTEGAAYFSVEEYKRPKFEVVFKPVQGAFRLGDTVQARGAATAYSGAALDGAAVAYRVVRTARFPMWWWYWRSYYPASAEMEIASGTSRTAADGTFDFRFPAIPDASVDRASDPIFDYRLHADVTDLNGETHSTQTTVSVGYKALAIRFDAADGPADVETGHVLAALYTTNLAGQPEPATGTVKIWKLKPPARALRQRLWQRPDRHVFTPDEFRALFPHDAYADEDNPYTWPRETEVFSLAFSTVAPQPGKAVLNAVLGTAGRYVVEAVAKDRFGQEVKEVAYYTVTDPAAKTPAYPAMQVARVQPAAVEPGQTAVVLAGTAAEAVTVLYEIEQDGKVLAHEWLVLSGEQRRLEIPIRETHRGGLAVHLTFVKHNRLYTSTLPINVPHTDKQLAVQFETFRDKLQPGQAEQWKLKVTGPKAEKVMAELVATLYDASLDAFRPHHWHAAFYQAVPARLAWQSQNGFVAATATAYQRGWSRTDTKPHVGPEYAQLNWFGYGFGSNVSVRIRGVSSIAARSSGGAPGAAPMVQTVRGGDLVLEDAAMSAAPAPQGKVQVLPAKPDAAPPAPVDMSAVKMRTNFNETAFFYPHLLTNAHGEIIVSFTVPEALTRWKMLGFAHTKTLQSGLAVRELVTQKELMVVPNAPRFLREGDRMRFSVKITSLADRDLSGQAQLEWLDALTGKILPQPLQDGAARAFTVKARQSVVVAWTIQVPDAVQALAYRVAARAGDFSDGESMTLPVVPNRMLVTETLPLPVRGGQTKAFSFDKLLAAKASTTLRHQRYTLEFTSNPAWYAVQALPYLMEYPYDCVEQVFSRYYANSLAAHIANANPKIKRVLDAWRTVQPDALLSNLEKNPELKSALLEETPWVLNAKDESQRKRNVALLFDLNRMAHEQARALEKMQQAQLGNGGFAWFPGFPEDRYMTQHIVAGLGHLDVLGVQAVRRDAATWAMAGRAVQYLDGRLHDDHQRLLAEAKKGRAKLADKHIGAFEVHYLYARSFFKDVPVTAAHKAAFDYYLGQARRYWLSGSVYTDALAALALHRFGDKTVPAAIVRSLDERALQSDEMGKYWKTEHGYHWHQAPVETQALLIELYDEVAADARSVEEMKVWLLKQKQVQDWRTTRATAEACYALLRRGTDALADDRLAEVTVGTQKLDPGQRDDTRVEAGTGYFKMAWAAADITPDMGRITVAKVTPGVAWGAVYWQYFEQLDKITAAETPLKLKKQLFVQQNTDRGPVISPVGGQTALKVGDLVKVRIELRVDRDMEYVHLKDMRAAAFEPVETLSHSKYQDGLWYYESPRDLATHFFMGYLPKGTYVFEYPLRVSQQGDFSNGITTIQCLYAPEFSSHSEGVRVTVGE